MRRGPGGGDPVYTFLEAPGGPYRVAIRRSSRARRIGLRVVPARREAALVLPARARLETGLAFVEEKRDWLAAHLSALAPHVPFAEGAVFPLRGCPTRIERADGPPGAPVRRMETDAEAGEARLVVPVRGEGRLAARIAAFLKAEARADLEGAVARHGARLDLRPARVRLADTASRWGSCSSRGTLSFSWRLVLAPPRVLDYVAAHEVCHLAEMNHGPAYWRLVARACPDFEAARGWLKAHGADLHRYGRAPG